jgi:hypothetical protein
LSPRRFSFHTTQSGEGSRRSKRCCVDTLHTHSEKAVSLKRWRLTAAYPSLMGIYTETRQVPKRTKAAIGIKQFAIFFIVCSYLKASQNTWASVKENE